MKMTNEDTTYSLAIREVNKHTDIAIISYKNS